MARLGRFITSYVRLVIGSLVVILVSMNTLASRQTDWQLLRALRFEQSTLATAEAADYKAGTDTRSIVIKRRARITESGVA